MFCFAHTAVTTTAQGKGTRGAISRRKGGRPTYEGSDVDRGFGLPSKRRSVDLSSEERTALFGQALFPLAPENVQDLFDPFSEEHNKAKEVLVKAGLLDSNGEYSIEAENLSREIRDGTRALGTPREDALARYEHLNDKTFTAETYDSLVSKGYLNADWEATDRGWAEVARSIGGDRLRVTLRHWLDQVKEAESKEELLKQKWASLDPYVDSLRNSPPESPQPIQAPTDVVDYCNECLRNARICMMVGVWAGAIQYCAVAVECILGSVLLSGGDNRQLDELPAMEELVAEVGGKVPQIRKLTKNLITDIKNFRNDSVHPRSRTNRPGESQARNVYDLTTRLLDEVRDEWFGGRKG